MPKNDFDQRTEHPFAGPNIQQPSYVQYLLSQKYQFKKDLNQNYRKCRNFPIKFQLICFLRKKISIVY